MSRVSRLEENLFRLERLARENLGSDAQARLSILAFTGAGMAFERGKEELGEAYLGLYAQIGILEPPATLLEADRLRQAPSAA